MGAASQIRNWRWVPILLGSSSDSDSVSESSTCNGCFAFTWVREAKEVSGPVSDSVEIVVRQFEEVFDKSQIPVTESSSAAFWLRWTTDGANKGRELEGFGRFIEGISTGIRSGVMSSSLCPSSSFSFSSLSSSMRSSSRSSPSDSECKSISLPTRFWVLWDGWLSLNVYQNISTKDSTL